MHFVTTCQLILATTLQNGQKQQQQQFTTHGWIEAATVLALWRYSTAYCRTSSLTQLFEIFSFFFLVLLII